MKTLLCALLFSALTMAADVTGKWSGTMEVKAPDGSTQSRPLYLILKQDGARLSGSGGPDESEQHPFENGKVDGDRLTFAVPAGGGNFEFAVRVAGDAITGDLKRNRGDDVQTAKIQIKRVKQN